MTRPDRRSGERRARGRIAMLGTLVFSYGCFDVPHGSQERNNLSDMATASVRIVDRTSYTVYIAREDPTGADKSVQLGLMNVTQDELADDHGMLFVFRDDRLRNFWMRNTIIPLDIAYIRSDGIIVQTYTMQPLNESGYPSIEPARFALEVKGGQFARWQVQPGDRVEIPPELFD